MGPKIITIPYIEPKDDQAALTYALSLAEIFGARVEVLYIAPDFENVAMPALVYGAMPYFPDASILDLRGTNEKRKKAAKTSYEKIIQDKNFKNAYFFSYTGLIEDILATKGRLSDVIIVPRTEENINYNNAANGALFGSGRPVILVPPNYNKDFNKKILIAWNGSREAANAVYHALPYMHHAKVSILTAVEHTKSKLEIAPGDLMGYLQTHGIKTDVIPPIEKESSLPVSILNAAKALDAGMIVTGAWGHGRFHEFIFGGVTDYMINHADIPVFMAH